MKKKKLTKHYKIVLIEELFLQIKALNKGKADLGSFNDSSDCSWIDLHIDDYHLAINFNKKGNKLTGIGLYKDVIQVVDQTKIF